MAVFEILVPANYADKVGGKRGQTQRVTITAKNAYLAQSELTKKWGIPWGVVSSVPVSEVPEGSTATAGSINLRPALEGNKDAVAFNEKFAVGANIGALQIPRARLSGSPLATEQSSSSGLATGTPSTRTLSADTKRMLAEIGIEAASGSGNQFIPDFLSEYRIREAETFKPVVPLVKPDPKYMRTLFPQGEGGMEGTDAGLTDEQKAMFDAFDPGSNLGSSVDVTGADRTDEERAGASGTGGIIDQNTTNTLDIDQIIDMFGEDTDFGKAVIGTDGEEIINPLLSNLLLVADSQANRVSFQQIAHIEARSREQVALFNKEAAIETARQSNLSDAEIARLTTQADIAIATARDEVDKYIADQQRVGTQANATATAAAAESARLGQEAAAKSMAGGQLGAAQATAGSASPFGFVGQGLGTDEYLTALERIFTAQQAPDAANAAANNLAAQNNAFSFAAGQETFDPNQIGQIAANSDAAFAARGQSESARLQSEAQIAIAQIQSNVGLGQNDKEYQIAQIIDQTQRALAVIQGGFQQGIASTQAGGQLGSAQVAAGAASPYGFLLQGGTPNQLEQIFAGQNAVGMAQANPYGQTAVDIQLLQDTQFNPYALTNAQGYALGQAQAANNPYAATQLGQDSARIDQILRGGLSPEQRISEINASQSGQNLANQLNFMSNPSAIGFASEQGLFGGVNNQLLRDINNSPEGNLPGSLFGFNSPSSAGAGGNQTTNTGNFNANTLRNASDEQIGFLQGAASAGGQTPSEFNQQVQSFTPQGY